MGTLTDFQIALPHAVAGPQMPVRLGRTRPRHVHGHDHARRTDQDNLGWQGIQDRLRFRQLPEPLVALAHHGLDPAALQTLPANQPCPTPQQEQRKRPQVFSQVPERDRPDLIDAKPPLIQLVVNPAALRQGQPLVEPGQQIRVTLAHGEGKFLREASLCRQRDNVADAELPKRLHPGQLADEHGIMSAVGQQLEAIGGRGDWHQLPLPSPADCVVVRQIGVDHDDGLVRQVRLGADARLAPPHEDRAMHDHVRHGKIRKLTAGLRLGKVDHHIHPPGLELLERLAERPDPDGVIQPLVPRDCPPQLDREAPGRRVCLPQRKRGKILLTSHHKRLARAGRRTRRTSTDPQQQAHQADCR